MALFPAVLGNTFHMYATWDDFMADVTLLVENCITYVVLALSNRCFALVVHFSVQLQQPGKRALCCGRAHQERGSRLYFNDYQSM